MPKFISTRRRAGAGAEAIDVGGGMGGDTCKKASPGVAPEMALQYLSQYRYQQRKGYKNESVRTFGDL